MADRDVHLLNPRRRFGGDAKAQVAYCSHLSPDSPVRPMTVILHWRAASIARRIFALLPLVEIASSTSPGRHGQKARGQKHVHIRNRFRWP